MPSNHNAAARLHSVLVKAKKSNLRSTPAISAWANLLNAEPSNEALVLKRLGAVMELPSTIKTKVESLSDVDHELYLRWVPKLVGAFRATHLGSSFSSFLDNVDDTTLFGIEHCSALLGRKDPEPEIAKSELDFLRIKVQELIEEVRTNDIDLDVRKFLLKHLLTILNAIEEYEIFGSRPLTAALGEAVASTITEPLETVKAGSIPTGGKFWKCVIGLAALLTVTGQGLEIAERIEKLLPAPAKPAIEVEVMPSPHRLQPHQNAPGKSPSTVT